MPSPDEAPEDAGVKPRPSTEPAAQAVPEPPKAPAKRPRGRPRKNPLPVVGVPPAQDSGAGEGAVAEGVVGHVAVASGESPVESALLLHSAAIAGAPGAPLPDAAPPKRPRGRPRKYPIASGPSLPAEPGAPPAASLGGTAILTGAASAVGPVPAAASGQAAVVVKRPRGRPRKHPLPDTGGISGGVSVPQGQGGGPGLVGARQVSGMVAESGAAAAGRPRGRRSKAEPSILNPFCPECGTYLRMFRPPRGRWRKVCPRCEPERMVVKRDYRDYIDKTGMPCKDRGKCRPERCVKALECEEMGRYR
jgi:hypothetical protein